MTKESRSFKIKTVALLTGVSISAVSGLSAWAQDAQLEEEINPKEDVIVVTARFRE